MLRHTRHGIECRESPHEPLSAQDGPQQAPEHAFERIRQGRSGSSRSDDALRLQAVAGNRATIRALSRSPGSRSSEAATPARSRLNHPIQAMLELGDHDDAFERQAHAMASQATSPTPTRVERARPVGRSAGLGGVSQAIESQILSARSGGRGLPADFRRSMSERMGASFDHVRVHTDRRADSLSRSLRALAFTTGPDIFFRHGQYDLGNARGRNMLAHELAHVVQQTGGQHGTAVSSGPPRIQRYFAIDESTSDELVTADNASFPVQREGKAGEIARALKEAIIANDLDAKNDLLTQLEAHVSGELWQQIDKLRDDHPKLRELLFHQVRGHSYYTEVVGKCESAPPLALASKKTIPSLLVSDNGRLAVEDTAENEQAKTFFAEREDVEVFNKALEELSSVTLVAMPDQKLTVPEWDGKRTHELVQVYARRADAKHQAKEKNASAVKDLSPKEEQLINSLVTPEQCVEMAEFITGEGLEKNPSPSKDAAMLPHSRITAAVGVSFVKFLLTYMNQRKDGFDEDAATKVAIKAASDIHQAMAAAKGKLLPEKMYSKLYVHVDGPFAKKAASNMFDDLVARKGAKTQADEKRLRVTGKDQQWQVEFMFESVFASSEQQARQLLLARYGLNLATVVNAYKISMIRSATQMLDAKEVRSPEQYLPDGQLRDHVEEELGRQLMAAKQTPEFAEITREFGINEHASPEVGQAYAIHRSGIAEGAPYHWAGVVAQDGRDTMVLENFQRGSGRAEDLRAFFTIYGPWREFKQKQDKDSWQKGTWYKRHADHYPGLALVHKPTPK